MEGAGLMVRVERHRQALEEGEKERASGAYICVYDEGKGRRKKEWLKRERAGWKREWRRYMRREGKRV